MTAKQLGVFQRALNRFDPIEDACAKPPQLCRTTNCWDDATEANGRCLRCNEEVAALRASYGEGGTEVPDTSPLLSPWSWALAVCFTAGFIAATVWVWWPE